MKTIVATLCAISFAVTLKAQTNAIDRFFQQYVNDQNFTVVYISPKMFQMMDKLNIKGMNDNEGRAILEIAKDLRGLRILTTDVNPKQYYKEAKSKINTTEYELLMTIRDKDNENVEFYVKEAPDSNGKMFDEFFMLIGGSDDFALISFVGKIDLTKISKLADSIENSNDSKTKKKEE